MSFLSRLKSFFWPQRCVFCRKLLPAGEWVCPSCKRETAESDLRYYIFMGNNARCFQCLSSYAYEGRVKEALYRFKFRDHPGYAAFFGARMAETVKKHLVPGLYSAVTCVPLSEKRRKTRGYDQAELLARKMAEELSLPFESTLRKEKENREQHSLKAADRHKNVAGVYGLLPGCDVSLKRYLLVDDIITTGNTVSECARELKKRGAEEVICVSAAKVP